MKFFMFVCERCVKDYEMKMNNLLVNVEILSLCHKETLFQVEFQQYIKWKLWSPFLTDKF